MLHFSYLVSLVIKKYKIKLHKNRKLNVYIEDVEPVYIRGTFSSFPENMMEAYSESSQTSKM